jgi:hypothetical protein
MRSPVKRFRPAAEAVQAVHARMRTAGPFSRNDVKRWFIELDDGLEPLNARRAAEEQMAALLQSGHIEMKPRSFGAYVWRRDPAARPAANDLRSSIASAPETNRRISEAEREQKFDTFDDWTVKSELPWLQPRGELHPIFFDAQGRLCRTARDFVRARDESAFPVSWVWPDQVGEHLRVRQADEIAKAVIRKLVDHAMPDNWHEDDLSPEHTAAWRAALLFLGEDPNALIAEDRASTTQTEEIL